jgi:hypothetical protein
MAIDPLVVTNGIESAVTYNKSMEGCSRRGCGDTPSEGPRIDSSSIMGDEKRGGVWVFYEELQGIQNSPSEKVSTAI